MQVSGGPLGDLSLLRAKPHFDKLRMLADELRELRDRFGPIFEYYFPDNWFVTIARRVHLVKQPDLSRYATDLQAMRDQAWRIVEDAKAVFTALIAIDIEPQFKQFAQLAYHQVDADGAVIILMNEFTKATDPKAFVTYFAAMKKMSDRARQNLMQMQALGARIQRD